MRFVFVLRYAIRFRRRLCFFFRHLGITARNDVTCAWYSGQTVDSLKTWPARLDRTGVGIHNKDFSSAPLWNVDGGRECRHGSEQSQSCCR